jgi:uncharacterized protein (DUF2141 family)
MCITSRFVLITLGALLLNSCAQVGVLSGGEQDLFAPAPKKMIPEQNTINFTGNTVEIELNEFVELNNPQQNIIMVPAHAKPKVKLTKKTLLITWDETLAPNTTYSIYMNGLVKDITEGNDSLMAYVFSTGPIIDSLFYETSVENSRTNDAVNKCLVGLYTISDTTKPLYFSRSDESGYVRINNIKADQYRVRAFMDDDKDLKANKTELRGFRTNPIQLDSSYSDSIKLRLYVPLNDDVRSFKFLAPGAFALGSASSMNQAQVSLNGEEILGSAIRMITNDSLLFFARVDTLTSVKAIVNRADRTDTLSYFLTKADKTTKSNLKPTLKSGVYRPNDPLTFELNDQIIGVSPSKITITNPTDSATIPIVDVRFEQNLLTIDVDRSNFKNLKIHFEKGSLRLLNGPDNEEAIHTIELKSEKDLGTIAVQVWKDPSPLLVELLSKNEILDSKIVVNPDVVKFSFLSPGEYNFRVTEDRNNNEKWDSGDESKSIQPEIIRYFSGPRVRPNWEVEVQLDPKEE